MKILKNFLVALIIVFSAGCINSSSETKQLNKFDLQKVRLDKDTYASVIIGGGFGGLTSGMYLAQANIKNALIQGEIPGGAITMSYNVCNWPAEKNISGQDLAEKILEHAKKSGVNLIEGTVEEVDFSVWPYLVKIKNNSEKSKVVKALTCIIATGAKSIFLNIPGEQDYFGKGISKCATCDGPFYKNKVVAVVGGGNSAISDASYLSNIAKKVYLIVRRDKLRATGKFVDEVIAKPNIEILYNRNVKEVLGDDKKVTSLKIYNNKNDKISNLRVDGMFLAVGAIPNSKLFKGKLDMDENGYIIVDKGQETSKKGVYSVGDVCEPEYKQLIIAAGQGAKAAIHAQKFLDEIGYDQNKLGKENEISIKEIEKKPIDEKKEKFVKNIKEKTTKVTKEKLEENVSFGQVIELESVQDFKREVLNYQGDIVVDFYAHWCFPCKMMMPIIKELAAEFTEIKFVKADVSKIQELGAIWGVQGVPTFMFFKDGKNVLRFSGGRDKAAFKQLIQNRF